MAGCGSRRGCALIGGVAGRDGFVVMEGAGDRLPGRGTARYLSVGSASSPSICAFNRASAAGLVFFGLDVRSS